MQPRTPDIVDFHKWDRKILTSYWLIVTLISTAALAMFFLREVHSTVTDFALQFVIPSAIMYAVLTAAEIFSRKKLAGRHYMLLLTSSTVSIVLTISFTDVYGIQLSFMHSILAAISYFDRRKAVFSSTFNVSAFLVLYLIYPELRDRIGPMELTFTLFFFLNSVVMLFGMISRGIALHRNLLQSVVENQDMIIRHTLMERQAKVDALTDLYNHKSFQEFLEDTVAQADRGVFQLHLAMIDIDNFKGINDTFGHAQGDIVLRHVAEAIKDSLSAGDIGARYGGEEFAVILTDRTPEDSLQVVERLRETVAQAALAEIGCRQVTVSIGLCTYRPGQGKEALFAGADANLYVSKRSGKNRTTLVREAASVRS